MYNILRKKKEIDEMNEMRINNKMTMSSNVAEEEEEEHDYDSEN